MFNYLGDLFNAIEWSDTFSKHKFTIKRYGEYRAKLSLKFPDNIIYLTKKIDDRYSLMFFEKNNDNNDNNDLINIININQYQNPNFMTNSIDDVNKKYYYHNFDNNLSSDEKQKIFIPGTIFKMKNEKLEVYSYGNSYGNSFFFTTASKSFLSVEQIEGYYSLKNPSG
jgi:hypothetical protein